MAKLLKTLFARKETAAAEQEAIDRANAALQLRMRHLLENVQHDQAA